MDATSTQVVKELTLVHFKKYILIYKKNMNTTAKTKQKTPNLLRNQTISFEGLKSRFLASRQLINQHGTKILYKKILTRPEIYIEDSIAPSSKIKLPHVISKALQFS